jgi:hypothetical protein
MPTVARKPKKQVPNSKAGPVKKTSRRSPASKPFLRFYHSESLRVRTLAVLDQVEKAKDKTQHRGALADVVVELTDSGMDYFFLRPLKIASAGFLVEQSANLGMAAATRVLGAVIRNIIGRMDNAQLMSVSGSIRELMR